MRTLSVTIGRRLTAGLVAALTTIGVVGGIVPTAHADTAPVGGATATNPATVAADVLPTVQIDGVAWSQVIVGNTVYVAGDFHSARPAGAAAGTNETTRNNLLAYDIRTGALVTSFAPDLNGQALSLAASPDGSRIYVGGDFTTANGVTRFQVAAYSTSTGELLTTWKPAVGGQVRAIAATETTVYLGGTFTAVGGVARNRLAAVSAATGALLPWAPVPGPGPTDGNDLGPVDGQPNPKNSQLNYSVNSLLVVGGGSQVVTGGRFDTLNGVKATGIGALDPVTGETRPFAVNQLITNQGVNSAIFSLSTDGTNVYATGYDFYGPGNVEGTVAANALTGELVWMADCHGDSYSSAAHGGALYIASHSHVCSNIGGFPEGEPHHGTAYSLTAAGTVGSATIANYNFTGKPAPAVLNWYPSFYTGKYTGQGQAGWSVVANDQYVLYGGEFPGVNGRPAQGLARFAVPSIAPNKIGPDADAQLTPTVVPVAAGTARVSWHTASDKDNAQLTYRVYRDDKGDTPVYETTAVSSFYDRPTIGFADTGLTPGATYTYRVAVADPFGNTVTSSPTSVTVTGEGTAASVYADAVEADAPSHYWRLGESTGSASFDQIGFDDLQLGAGVALGRAGALTGDTSTAIATDGTSSGLAATQSAVAGPQVFSVEAWFSTTSRAGGKIVGFGNASSGTSSSYDRHVYMDGAGRVLFGVYPGTSMTVSSDTGFNDGTWHHVVATLGSNGMAMYLDGRLVGSRSDATSAQAYSGYWRIGGDNSWAGAPWFDGRIDEVAVYPTALTAAQVLRHQVVGTTGQTYNEPPSAAFGTTTAGLAVTADGSASADVDGTVASWSWAFGDGTKATGEEVSHTYASAGSYRVELTVTDDRGATSTTREVVGVSSTGTVGSSYSAAVLADGAADYWRLGETSGVALDWAGTADLAVGRWLTRGTAGAIVGDRDAAMTFYGMSGGLAATQTAVPGPQVFSVEAWFSTTSTAGGKIVGFGNASSGTSGSYDRHVYMDGSGRVLFGVYPGREATLSSDAGLNDGRWHHVVASLSGAGMTLYVDGTLVGSRTDATSAQSYSGYWRIGGDSTWAGAQWFDGKVDDVAIYPTTLSAATVSAHRTLGVVGSLPNEAPTAGLTSTVTDLGVALDGTTSGDTDGTVANWSWDLGDGTTASGPTASHTYAAAGTYTVRLTVTDDDGATGTVERPVTVTAPNQAPTAAFTTAVTGLDVAADGSSSADADGAVSAYAWDFGDGSTGQGSVAQHGYTAAGTYTVTLTVTDDDGATATTSRSVSVEVPPVAGDALAVDSFTRSVTGALGTADLGGAWTAGSGTSVSAGAGHLSVAGAGRTLTATLAAVTGTDVASQVTVTLPGMPTGGGTYVKMPLRVTGSNAYRAGVKVTATGGVSLVLSRVVNGAETSLRSVTVPGVRYVAGEALVVRADVSGTDTTTLRAKAWPASAAEPADWQATAQDSTAVLRAPGAVGVLVYASGSSTALPVVADLDDFWAGPSGSTPAAAPAANLAPRAAFDAVPAGLGVIVDGSASADTDGSVQSWAWDFGDGATTTGVTATHTYAAAGSYTVTLTVADDDGTTATTSRPVVVEAAPDAEAPENPAPVDQAPTAAFTTSTTGLSLSVDGAGSSDAEGPVRTWAWDFGDGATTTGVTATHSYAQAGTYTVSLAVTDGAGTTGTLEQSVTVGAETPVDPLIGTDTFERSVEAGLGAADLGGDWTVIGGSSSVSDGAGHLRVTTPGSTTSAWLGSLSAGDVALQTSLRLTAPPTGGGTYVYLAARRTGSTSYRATLKFTATGSVIVSVTRLVGGAESTLRSYVLPEKYAAGDVLNVRLDVAGTGTTTLNAKAWAATAAEPAAWQVTATDTTAALQTAGAVGVATYVSGSATVVPVQLDLDDVWVGPAGTGPAAR